MIQSNLMPLPASELSELWQSASVALGRFLDSDDDQHDASHEGQPAYERRKRNRHLRVDPGYFLGDIANLLGPCKADVAVDQCHNAKEDQADAHVNDRSGVDKDSFLLSRKG